MANEAFPIPSTFTYRRTHVPSGTSTLVSEHFRDEISFKRQVNIWNHLNPENWQYTIISNPETGNPCA